ncbi:MAG: phosphorylase [Alphaproteobacteria bacterium]|nr:phosphorylase [Alphaproteobacteria bacterium]
MLLAVTGMQREAKLLRGRCEVIVAGSDNSTLASKIEAGIARGSRALLSFGICGALSPELAVGTVLIGNEVVFGGQRWRADEGWSNTLASACSSAMGTVAGSDSILLTAAAKAALHAPTGALAADMESHIVARVASERELPFAVLRAVSDDAHHALPPAAAFGLRKDGRIDYSAVMLSLLDEPSQWRALFRTAHETKTALKAISYCIERIGPTSGFPAA